MSENKMSEIIRASVDGLKSSFDANTIIGEAITTANGTVVIPVSKLSVGFASGGIDYMGKKAAATSSNNFGGGGGSGLSVVPVAFLIISPTGNVELLNINDTKEPADPVSQIINAIERSPELIEKFKEVFSKNK
ncbi:MAG: sporulation protein YtfJ [Clostridiales bacterium]|jgi:sporulation protein YtfJ|nr:sporulation protein YtfJ [Clostridiales bacterium]